MDEKKMDEKKLDKWIERYLLWMMDKNYSHRTIESHQGMLEYFHKFVQERGLCFEQAVKPQSIDTFLNQRRLQKAPFALNGFKRYLQNRQVIAAEPEKDQTLPGVFEESMHFYQRTRNVSSGRIKLIRRVLSDFNAFLEQQKIALNDLEIETVDAFLNERNKGRAPGTCATNRFAVCGLLRYLYTEKKLITRDLASLVVSAPVFNRDNPPKYLRPDEVRALYASLSLNGSKDIRTAAMVLLACTTGLRPSEIARISLDHIRFTRAELAVTLRKGKNPMVFPLPDQTMEAIAAYVIGVRPESDHRRLFLEIAAPFAPISVYVVKRCIKSALKKAGIEASVYHLRHTYAQNLLESGASLFEIKEMLGHDDIKSTKRYLHIHIRLMREVLFDEFDD